MKSLLFWLTCLAGVLLVRPLYGQTIRYKDLEDQVYAYNNALNYTASQALLLPIINSPAYTPTEHYQAAVLLSYTYKRLNDYPTTLQWLGKARQLATKTPKPDSCVAQILAQQALAYFDVHSYAKSDNLMRALEQTRFRYIDQENRAKLVHQQGFLLFKANRYPEAEATYDRAIPDLLATSGCDMPMILVKKMQLYAAMNRMGQARAMLAESNRYADSCGIIKYRIYAFEELYAIYKARHDAPRIAATMQTLDSLNAVYNRAEQIASLHNQKEALEQQVSDRKLQHQQQRGGWLTVGMGLLGLTALLLFVSLWAYRQRQRVMEADIARMRTELAQYVAHSQTLETRQNHVEQRIEQLSERQQQVLTYLMQGLSNREMADRLVVSENTVKYHIKNIYDELQIKNRRELLLRLRR